MQNLTDHSAIREWALARTGKPALYQPPGGEAVLRLEFGQQSTIANNNSVTDTQTQIEWPDWFKVFDEKKLVLVVQDEQDGVLDSSHSFGSR